MPIYEYACKKCGEQFEVFRSVSDRPLREHEACGGELRKVFYPAGLVFKGSGFYTTDSRPKAKAKKEDGDSGKKKDAKKPEEG